MTTTTTTTASSTGSTREGDGATTTDGRRDEPAELTPVFVEPLGDGFLIDLSVQAGVVKNLDAIASVRFIDDRAEAIDEEKPGEPVKKAGMLVALGPLVRIDDEQRTVQVRRYVDEASFEDLVARITASGETWTVELHPSP